MSLLSQFVGRGPTGYNVLTSNLNNLESSGQSTNLIVGENIIAGQICYYKSDSKVWLSISDSELTSGGVLILLALQTVNQNLTGSFLMNGFYRNDSVFNMTVGLAQYIDSTTPGLITETPPSVETNIVRLIGYAKTSHILFFSPDESWVEV